MRASVLEGEREVEAGLVSGDRPDVLAAIGPPGVSLAVWRRSEPRQLVDLLDQLPADALPHLRLDEVPTLGINVALAAALGPRTAALAPLVDDAAMLADRYAALTGARDLRLRLERVTDDACRRFHADSVRSRLLCTYLGPGTEWLPTAAVRLAADGLPAEPTDPRAIRRLGRFEVGVLKGRLWPGSRPTVHRSPPIAETGVTRLLLCIDEACR